MRKLLVGLIVLVLAAVPASAWFTSGLPVRAAYISRIGGFTAIGASYTNALDWGTNGLPLQVEVKIIDPPTQQAWSNITSMSLQFALGTNADAVSWTNISTVTANNEINLNRTGAHFGFEWTPPTSGAMLLRLLVTIAGGYTSASTNENSVSATGGVTWENWEVVGITVRTNKLPGVR